MRKSFGLFSLIILAAALFGGCGSDGPTPPPPPVPVARLVVDTTVTAPAMTDVDDPVWNLIDSSKILIGRKISSTWYDANIGDTVVMKAILKGGVLFIKARWRDGSANLWGEYIIKSDTGTGSYNYDWEHVVYTGQDKFHMLIDNGDNGTEKANCATMCHGTYMRTSGGGHVDALVWGSTKNLPVRMAEDQWWSATSAVGDPILSGLRHYPYLDNWDAFALAPRAMHEDTTDFLGPFLYKTDTLPMDKVNKMWPISYRMPGYIIDSSIYSDPTRTNESLWDVLAIGKQDSTTTPYTWVVVFARSLNTGHADDVNLQGLDSVQVSIAAAHNFAPDMKEHSGSKPFYLILKP